MSDGPREASACPGGGMTHDSAAVASPGRDDEQDKDSNEPQGQQRDKQEPEELIGIPSLLQPASSATDETASATNNATRAEQMESMDNERHKLDERPIELDVSQTVLLDGNDSVNSTAFASDVIKVPALAGDEPLEPLEFGDASPAADASVADNNTVAQKPPDEETSRAHPATASKSANRPETDASREVTDNPSLDSTSMIVEDSQDGVHETSKKRHFEQVPDSRSNSTRRAEIMVNAQDTIEEATVPNKTEQDGHSEEEAPRTEGLSLTAAVLASCTGAAPGDSEPHVEQRTLSSSRGMSDIAAEPALSELALRDAAKGNADDSAKTAAVDAATLEAPSNGDDDKESHLTTASKQKLSQVDDSQGMSSHFDRDVEPHDQMEVTVATAETVTESVPDPQAATPSTSRTVSARPANSSSVTRPPTSLRNSTYFGGMLASNKAMKPFRSPVIKQKQATAIPLEGGSEDTGSADQANALVNTPSRPSSVASRRTSSLLSGASTSQSLHAPSLSALRNTSQTSRASGLHGSAKANSALNKPFKSLLSNRPIVQSSATTGASMSDAGLTSIELSTGLPKLERRLAMLKDAKRHLAAIDKGLDSADNTDHIKELSLKWLEKGREAAEMLWELVKDQMASGETGETRDSGIFASGGNNSWGWDTPADRSPNVGGRRSAGWARNRVAEHTEGLKRKVKEDLDALEDAAREELYHQMGKDGSLPEIDPKAIFGSRKRRRLQNEEDEDEPVGRNNEVDDDDDDDDQNMQKSAEREDNDALSPDQADAKSEAEMASESEDGDADIEEDPKTRGMAKMLIQCGVDLKTFGWDAREEEWDIADVALVS